MIRNLTPLRGAIAVALLALCLLLPTGCAAPSSGAKRDTRLPSTASLWQQWLQQREEFRQLLNITIPAAMGEGALQRAGELLTSIDPIPKDTYLATLLTLRQAELSAAAGNLGLALQQLPTEQWLNGVATHDTEIPIALRITIHRLRATLLERSSDYAGSARELMRLSSFLQPRAQKANNQQIWRYLMALPGNTLREEYQRSDSSLQQGWFALALLSKSVSLEPAQKLHWLHTWQEQWPLHPAGDQLPDDLLLLATPDRPHPPAVTLLLPLSGPNMAVGQALRNGFLSAWFATRGTKPAVSFLDSGGEKDIRELYDEAVAAGSKLVIGPWQPRNIALLRDNPALPVPVLALNYTSDNAPSRRGLYQFGVLQEQEITQMVEQAQEEEIRSILLIHDNRPQTEQALALFQPVWEAAGGNIVETVAIGHSLTSYQNTIKEALQVSNSEIRHARIERHAGQNLGFQARRRNDIDAVFLFTDNDRGRILKPLLDFNFAHDLPVYALSEIYGAGDPSKDQDLNGVRFLDMPWILEPQSELAAIASEFLDIDWSAHSRFFALGIDAFRLHNYLGALERYPRGTLYSLSGAISLLPNGKILRRSDWMQVYRNQVRARAVLHGQTQG